MGVVTTSLGTAKPAPARPLPCSYSACLLRFAGVPLTGALFSLLPAHGCQTAPPLALRANGDPPGAQTGITVNPRNHYWPGSRRLKGSPSESEG